MTISTGRVVVLGLLSILMALLWDSPFLLPVKVFVVYLHEISHGLGALLTGGTVKGIAVRWNESGQTISVGGNFLAIASAGYVGSVLWGSLMLNSALIGRFTRVISIFIGLIIVFFTLFYLENFLSLIYFVGLAWGLALIASASLHETVNRFLLFFLGGLTSMYALYDLSDFFRGEVLATDAGIIASHYLGESAMRIPLAYCIAIFISLLSIWILYKIIAHAIQVRHEPEPEEEPALPEGISPEMLALFEQLQNQGKRNENG